MSEKIRVVFLDIEGVVSDFDDERLGKHRKATTFAETWCPTPKAVGNLLTLVNAYPNVEVVMSSTWRAHCRGPHVWECLFYAIGGYDRPINMCWEDTTTPKLWTNRGLEIGAWLLRNQDRVESFVILDDEADMEPYMDRLVRTDGDVGLTEADVVKAIEILGTEWK